MRRILIYKSTGRITSLSENEQGVVGGLFTFHSTGTDPDETVNMYGNENYAELTGLSPNTGYDFHVKSVCSDQDQSSWVKKSFTATCPPIDEFPYSESFENESETKDCWSIIMRMKIPGISYYRKSFRATYLDSRR